MYNRISTINIAVHYIQKLLKEQNPKSSHHQEIFFLLLIVCIYTR